MPHLAFIPQTLTDHGRRGNTISGYHLTETPTGYWRSPSVSAEGYMVGGDWWRSKCGHAVDLVVGVCPVCGEFKPE